jgi:hypothetical protein
MVFSSGFGMVFSSGFGWVHAENGGMAPSRLLNVFNCRKDQIQPPGTLSTSRK